MGFGNRQPLARVGQPPQEGNPPAFQTPATPQGGVQNPPPVGRDASNGPANLAQMYQALFARNPFKKMGANLNPEGFEAAGSQQAQDAYARAKKWRDSRNSPPPSGGAGGGGSVPIGAGPMANGKLPFEW